MKSASERSYAGLLWGLAAVGVILDQATKYGVFRWLYNDYRRQGEFEIVPGAFKLLAQFTGKQEAGTGPLATLRGRECGGTGVAQDRPRKVGA